VGLPAHALFQSHWMVLKTPGHYWVGTTLIKPHIILSLVFRWSPVPRSRPGARGGLEPNRTRQAVVPASRRQVCTFLGPPSCKYISNFSGSQNPGFGALRNPHGSSRFLGVPVSVISRRREAGGVPAPIQTQGQTLTSDPGLS